MNSLEQVISTFEAIKVAQGRNDKLALLKRLVKEDDEDILRSMLTYTFHPYWNYWIKLKLDDYKYKPSSKPFKGGSHLWIRFTEILDRLKDRKVTGNKARKQVEDFLEVVPNRIAYWFVQILNRKLEMKLQLKSFEKFYPDLVPKVCPMLAVAKKKGKPLKGEHQAEIKWDGERALAIFDSKGRGTVISRNGNPKTNCEHIIEEYQSMHDKPFANVVFDGELVGENWGDGGASRSKKKSKKKLVHKVFDILTLEDWEKRKNKMLLMDRREWLEEEIKETDHVKLSELIAVGEFSDKEIQKMADKVINDGHEGIMLKRRRSVYIFKRDEDWLKIKYKTTDDLKVVAAKEGRHRLKGTLGSLQLKGTVDGVKVLTWMGQGIKDKKRDELWERHKRGDLIGTIVEIEHYGLTSLLKAKKDDGKSALRNPVLLKVRDDKAKR